VIAANAQHPTRLGRRFGGIVFWVLIVILILASMGLSRTWAADTADRAVGQTGQGSQTKETPPREPDIYYVPTPRQVVDVMLELARVKKSDLVYDLGCGDGRIVVTAARKYGCKAVGVDIDPARVRESLANVKDAGVGHLVDIEQKDIFTLDLSKADVVMLYLLPSLNVRLIPQLEKMKPGSRVVSHNFDMYGVVPDVVVNISSKRDGEHKIYLWTVPFTKEVPPEAESAARRRRKKQHAQFDIMSAVLVVGLTSLGLAVIIWLLRKRLGVIRINVTVDRDGQ
jgi:SAM-dependent methyltransferase